MKSLPLNSTGTAAEIGELAGAEQPPLQALPPAGQRFYHPELDGLRFLAFLSVFAVHCFPVHPPASGEQGWLAHELVAWFCALPTAGIAGVDLFFVLSSFLITELLLREQERTGRIDIKAFYFRRGLRIWPLYFVFLTLSLVLDPLLGLPGLVGTWPLSFYGFVGNWGIAWEGKNPDSLAVILWTVSIEEQFYLVWPLVLTLVSPRRLGWLAAGLVAIAVLTRWMLVAQSAEYLAINCNTLARLDSIGIGCLVALVRRHWNPHLSSWSRIWLGGGGCLVILASCRYLKLEPLFPQADVLIYLLWGVGAGMILLGALQPTGAPGGWLASPLLVYLGRISYGLYVWHFACIMATYQWLGAPPGSLASAVYALPLTILVASLSYRFLEQPFLRWKQTFSKVASRDEAPDVKAELQTTTTVMNSAGNL